MDLAYCSQRVIKLVSWQSQNRVVNVQQKAATHRLSVQQLEVVRDASCEEVAVEVEVEVRRPAA